MLQRSLLRQPRALTLQALASRSSPSLTRLPPVSSRFPAPTKARILSRWYSASSEAQKSDSASAGADAAPAGDAAAAAAEGEASSPDEALRKELEAKNREVVDLKDKYLRSVADFRNLQERTKREIQSAKDFAIQRFAQDLVESVDNFDRALSTVPAEKLSGDAANQDLQALHGGLKMTETILMGTLKKHGLERFDPTPNGDKFDPNLHDATFMTPQPDKEDGTVFHTTQKGFMLNGRVLRAAKVGVVKNS